MKKLLLLILLFCIVSIAVTAFEVETFSGTTLNTSLWNTTANMNAVVGGGTANLSSTSSIGGVFSSYAAINTTLITNTSIWVKARVNSIDDYARIIYGWDRITDNGEILNGTEVTFASGTLYVISRKNVASTTLGSIAYTANTWYWINFAMNSSGSMNTSIYADGEGWAGTLLLNASNRTMNYSPSNKLYIEDYWSGDSSKIIQVDYIANIINVLANITFRDNITNVQIFPSCTIDGNAIGNTSAFFVEEGTRSLNCDLSNYLGLSQNISFPAVSSYNATLKMQPAKVFLSIYDEESLLLFNTSISRNVNRTWAEFVCENVSYVYDFNQTNTMSSIVPCSYSYIKLNLKYNDTSLGNYFRLLIPSPSTTSDVYANFYMVDLNTYSVVQTNLRLQDLTGQFSNGILRVKKVVSSGVITVIEQRFDVEDNTQLFLMKDAGYIIEIENDAGLVKSIGGFIPTSAAEKLITISDIGFAPQFSELQDNITWGYYFSVADGILRVDYNDTTGATTSWVFSVYNGSNTSQLLYTSGVLTGTQISSTYNGVLGNMTYYSDLTFTNTYVGTKTNRKIWGVPEAPSVIPPESESGFSSSGVRTALRVAALFVILIVALMFTAIHISAGIGAMAILMWMFSAWGWLGEIAAWKLVIATAFLALLAVFSWWVEEQRT